MLRERGVLPAEMKFSTTTEGKPYIVCKLSSFCRLSRNTQRHQASQTTNPPIAYNITHDNNLIAMAFGPGLDKPPAFSIGIDVMKLRVPWKDTVNSFIEIVGDQVR
jgi:4'-phosphopantetheinyl transferase